jgi:hypothetical protein
MTTLPPDTAQSRGGWQCSQSEKVGRKRTISFRAFKPGTSDLAAVLYLRLSNAKMRKGKAGRFLRTLS